MVVDSSNTSKQISKAEDEVSLKELILKIKGLINYLFSKWLLILIIAALGAALGLVIAVVKKPTYDAEITFVVEDEKGGGSTLSAYAGIASQFGINLGGMEGEGLFSKENIVEFMKSRRMIQQTLLSEAEFKGKRQLLIDRYVEMNELSRDWAKNEKLKNFRFTKDNGENFIQDSLIANYHKAILKKMLTVDKLDKKLSILSVTVNAKDELFAKAFCEKLITNVTDFYVKTRTKKSLDNLTVLTKQVDSVRAELNNAIGGVAAAAEANPNPNKAFQRLNVPSQKRTVDVQANTAILTELVKNQELARMTVRNAKPLIQVLDRPILPLEKNKIGKLMGILVGGFLGGFLCVCALLVRKIFRSILA